MRFQNVILQNATYASACSSSRIPSVKEYFEAGSIYGISLYISGALVLVTVILIFVDTLRHVISNTSPRLKSYTSHVIAIYPVICFFSYLTIIVPRAYMLSECLIQVILVVALYQVFCLFVATCEGEASLAKKVKGTKLSLQTTPICCFCPMLPKYDVTKKTLRNLKILVLQLPIIQGLIRLLIFVMWVESEEFYEKCYWYLQPFLIASLLIGMWGLDMTRTLLNNGVGSEFMFPQKLVILQLAVPVTQLQSLIINILVKCNVFPCNPPLVPLFYANLCQYGVIMILMLLLGFLAQRLYKRAIPEFDDKSIQPTGIISTVFAEPVVSASNGVENQGFS